MRECIPDHGRFFVEFIQYILLLLDKPLVGLAGVFRLTSPLHVCGEICLPIQQALLAPSLTTPITRVVSHPQALAQCLGWLHANLPEAVLVEASSTAVAAAEAAARDDSAAIGGTLLADEHRLVVMEANIADKDSNQTRAESGSGQITGYISTTEKRTGLIQC